MIGRYPVLAAALVTGAVVLLTLGLMRGLGPAGVARDAGAKVGGGSRADGSSFHTAGASERGDRSCVRAMRPVEVRGNSLGTLAPAGTRLVLLVGYYRCNPVRRGEVVALRYGGDENPLSKVVHGVPGDRLALEVTAQGERLLVNGQVAKTSEGIPFRIDAAADRMLRGYVRGFGGVIPEDAYLVLGDRPGRTVDSRRFGLVARADLLGVLVPAPPQHR